MSVRFNANADRLVRTNNLPTWDSYTFAGFFQLVNDTGGAMCLFSLEENGSSWHVVETPGGGDLHLHVYAGFSVDLNTTVTLVLGTWYFIAVTHDGTTLRTAICEVGSSSFTFASTTDNAPRTFATMVLMGDSFNEPPDGRGVGVREWSVILSDPELLAESQSISPVRTANLNAYYRELAAEERLTDFSGNGYNLSEVGGGAWETEENPPGLIGVAGDLVATSPAATMSAAGAVGVAGALGATSPAAVAAIAAGHGPSAALTATSPAATMSAGGTVFPIGGLTATSPAASCSMTGTAGVSGVLAATSPAATMVATGFHADVHSEGGATSCTLEEGWP